MNVSNKIQYILTSTAIVPVVGKIAINIDTSARSTGIMMSILTPKTILLK